MKVESGTQIFFVILEEKNADLFSNRKEAVELSLTPGHSFAVFFI